MSGAGAFIALWLHGTSLCSAAGHLCTASTAGHQYLFPAIFIHPNGIKGIASRGSQRQAELIWTVVSNVVCYE